MQRATRRARVGARLSLDKTDFKPTRIISRRHNHINIYVPNKAPQYMKKEWTDLKGGMASSTVIVGNVNTSLSIMDRTIRKSTT